MAGEWTLPLIQERLDALAVGQDFSLSRPEMEALFGVNGAAVARIVHFAVGHGCEIVFRRDGVKFLKPPPAAPGVETHPVAIN
jgi:hypothetical protein